MEKVYASIITIGDELLIGQVIDTNSAWIAQQLNEAGILVKERLSVGDVWHDIWTALDTAASHSPIVLITGGLGPTADDITKPLLCEYFGGNLVMDEKVLAFVESIFQKMNRPMLERNRRQAEVPDVCTVLFNSRGTAPGMWFEKNGVVFVSMPGVPHEMKGIMEKEVLPRLIETFHLPAIVHQTLLTAGIGESFLAETIQEWENALPAPLKLAYLPNYGMVRLRITGIGPEKTAITQLVQTEFDKLKTLVKPWLVTDKDERMEQVVGRVLHSRGLKMATAESCTGGYIAHLLTSLPGSSAWYAGSVVSYANEVKTGLLGVPEAVIAKEGAVSRPVVEQMVRGVIAQTGADVAVAVSGIMGPDGGSEEKPVGTVWVAVGNAEHVDANRMHFRFDRQRNIQLTSVHALNMLRVFLEGHLKINVSLNN
jgi:nicotinamide-nucleotide amidase